MSIGEDKCVADVMTRDVATITEDENLANLLGTMSTMRFRHIPVVDEARLVGLLTERDVLAMSASNLLPKATEQDRFLKERFRVRDVMVTDLITARAETPLADAARLMLDKRLGCLPVVDGANVLVGILTQSDFVRLVAMS